MKVDDRLLIFLDQDDRRPYRVNQHQQDGDQPRQTVNVECHPSCHFQHESRPCGIENKASPEKYQVPGFQAPRKSFTPHPDGVKHQRQGNQYCR